MQVALSEDQVLLQDTLERVFREHSTGARIRAAEEQGFDPVLWTVLVQQGLPMLRAPEQDGGASLMHAVVAAEQSGRHLASVPLVEAMVANRLLAGLGDAGRKLLDECAAGRSTATLALTDLRGRAVQLVPGGAAATHVVCLAGDEVRVLRKRDILPLKLHGDVGGAKIDLAAIKEAELSVNGARSLHEAALEEWKLLNAARVLAAGRRAVENAAAYACEREAFGRKIGEYQAVSHALADAVADMDGGRMLVWRTVDRIVRRAEDAAALVSMAAWWAGHAARPAAVKSMRIFGGYGMAMEYDAQLYYRKINAWSLLAGNGKAELLRAADRLWGGEKAALPEAGTPEQVGVDFDWGEEANAAAQRMRDFARRLDVKKQERFNRDSLDGFDREVYKELAREGLLYPDYPKDVGGPGLSLLASAAVYEVQVSELGWHMLASNATEMIGKIVYHFGSEEAKREILPKVVAGETYCSLGYTEPTNGSDIFAVHTSARRETDAPGSDWIINGQKMFTSVGHLADYSLMITRTAPDKYKGVTVFIAPLRQPGYDFTEIKTIGAERTNVTFYRELRVPDRYRVGEVNGGVKVMAAALTLEQSGGDNYIAGMRLLLRDALAWANEKNPNFDGAKPIDNEDVRTTLAETAVRLNVGIALSRFCYWAYDSGKGKKGFGPMAKLFCSESYLSTSHALLAAMAPESLEIGYDGPGMIEWLARRSIPPTIYGGTSEVQRSIVAEAVLGLPRTR
ncbi:MAG TPA: acyl-CoA dehydrogenase [Burkholderiales bacterium]|nr:acyl-CoA dehydrogenase [Burkholderiales bacterium]